MRGTAFGRMGGFGFGQGLTPVVKRLLIANTAVFFATWIVGAGFVVEWFAFHPGRLFTRPWGVFTYMFVHGGFWHLFVNMLVLFFFGPPLESRWGSREFFRFYLVAGFGGVLLSFLFGPGAAVVGASAAVYGVMLAFAMNWPDSPIYIWGIFPVKAKWLVAVLFVMSIVSAVGDTGGNVAHFAHLGGFLTAFLYLKMDWRGGEKMERLRKTTRKVRRLAIVPREEDDSPASSHDNGSGWSAADERRLLDAVDRVLDKISKEGMSALTAEEKSILDEASRRHRLN